jgi:hypothetical protein
MKKPVLNAEYEQFNKTMDTILKSDPKTVKQQMDEDARMRAEARKAKRASFDPGPDDQA